LQLGLVPITGYCMSTGRLFAASCLRIRWDASDLWFCYTSAK